MPKIRLKKIQNRILTGSQANYYQHRDGMIGSVVTELCAQWRQFCLRVPKSGTQIAGYTVTRSYGNIGANTGLRLVEVMSETVKEKN